MPYDIYHALGTRLIKKTDSSPDVIVLMGAGGMPGAESLLRLHYALELARNHPMSHILIALPADTTDFLNSDHYRMARYLMDAGIDSTRFLSDKIGTNTREQALNCMKLIQNSHTSLLLVTSPEHMYRAIRTFQKTGFQYVNGIPAFENTFSEELLISSETGNDGRKPIDQNMALRYNMWSYLQYEIKVLREITAITYYKIAGYI